MAKQTSEKDLDDTDVSGSTHFFNQRSGRFEVTPPDEPGSLRIKGDTVEVKHPDEVDPFRFGEICFRDTIEALRKGVSSTDKSNGAFREFMDSVGLETIYSTNSGIEVLADIQALYDGEAYRAFAQQLQKSSDIVPDLIYLSSLIDQNPNPTAESLAAAFLLTTYIAGVEQHELNKMIPGYKRLTDESMELINAKSDGRNYGSYNSKPFEDKEKEIDNYTDMMKDQGKKVVFAQRARTWVYGKILDLNPKE